MKAIRFLLLWSAGNAALLLAVFFFTYYVMMADAPPHTLHEGGEGDWHGSGECFASALISIALAVGANLVAGLAWLIHFIIRSSQHRDT